MFFTRQYDYALRVIRALSDMNLLSVNEICVIEHVPQPYAYKILKKLAKASFVSSSRGVNGGYRLTKNLEDISLHDIYVAVEGELYINECLQGGYECPHNQGGGACVIHKELNSLQNDFVEKLQERDMSSVLKIDA